jgi:hypothetical protein
LKSGEEVRAADDIATAFHAQAGALMIKPPSLEKRDATYHGHDPAWVIDAVSRYKRWARHWSERARNGDRTLEIVIAAVVDERAFHVIEADVGMAARTVNSQADSIADAAGFEGASCHVVPGEFDASTFTYPANYRPIPACPLFSICASTSRRGQPVKSTTFAACLASLTGNSAR